MVRNRAAILAKIETTYGTDPTPVPGTNAILCELPEFSVVGKKLERNNVQAFMGKTPPVNVGEGLKIKFTTELKGSGAAGTVPEIAPLFRACNMTETITVGTKVDYNPNSAVGVEESSESVTIYYYQDLILHKLLGCRGMFSISLKASEYGKITWEFTGIYGGPVAGTTPSGVPNGTLPPRFISAAFSIDSYSAIIESLSIEQGGQVVKRIDGNGATGVREWMFVDRDFKGKVDPEVPALATKSFWDMWSTSAQVAMTATVGQTAGNKTIITTPKLVLDVPTYAEREKILTHGLPFSLHPATGNDEVRFSFQ